MLTAERKKRGKKLPEGLFSPENISNFKQTASHPVSRDESCSSLCLYRVCIVLACPVYWHLICHPMGPVYLLVGRGLVGVVIVLIFDRWS